jgi:hypothetical protein
MSTSGSLQTVDACLERAVAIKTTAKLLHNQGDDWFAVCYFYAAYHIVRAAIMADPIFTDLGRLQQKSPHLTLGDRLATAHKGRVVSGSPRQLGVNDLVKILYPQIAAEYERLHIASVEVRYGEGLRGIHRDSVVEDYESIVTAYNEDGLVTE